MEDENADVIYQDTYNNSLNNTNQQIYEAESLRNEMYSG